MLRSFVNRERGASILERSRWVCRLVFDENPCALTGCRNTADEIRHIIQSNERCAADSRLVLNRLRRFDVVPSVGQQLLIIEGDGARLECGIVDAERGLHDLGAPRHDGFVTFRVLHCDLLRLRRMARSSVPIEESSGIGGPKV